MINGMLRIVERTVLGPLPIIMLRLSISLLTKSLKSNTTDLLAKASYQSFPDNKLTFMTPSVMIGMVLGAVGSIASIRMFLKRCCLHWPAWTGFPSFITFHCPCRPLMCLKISFKNFNFNESILIKKFHTDNFFFKISYII